MVEIESILCMTYMKDVQIHIRYTSEVFVNRIQVNVNSIEKQYTQSQK